MFFFSFFLFYFFEHFQISTSPQVCVNSRIVTAPTNFYISNCIYKSLTSSTDGGAISLTLSECRMLIEGSFFDTIIAPKAGAITFTCTGTGGSVLDKVCSHKVVVSSGQYYQFGYFSVSSSQKINRAFYLSITQSRISSATLYESVRFNQGNQVCDYMNSSYNHLSYGSGAVFNYPVNSSSSYCTFSNNQDNGYRCIYFYQGSGTCYMQYSNVVSNNQGSATLSNVFRNYQVTSYVSHCVLYQNIAKCMFDIESGKMYVSNCYSDNYLYYANQPIFLNKFGPSNTFIINHLNSYLCYAPYLKSNWKRYETRHFYILCHFLLKW